MRFIFTLLVLVWGFGSQAVQVGEVVCKPDGCLKEGWDFFDYVNSARSSLECRDGDCEKHGWIEYSWGGRYEFEAECDGAGCFKDGYRVYDRFTRENVFSAQCFGDQDGERDCLKHGWSGWNTQQSLVSRCRMGDCRVKGWTNFIAGRTESVICKREDCFTYGWTIHRP